MITLIETPLGYTWKVTHPTVPSAIAHKNYRNLEAALMHVDQTRPTYITLNGAHHEPDELIPLGFIGNVRIVYEGVSYVTQLSTVA